MWDGTGLPSRHTQCEAPRQTNNDRVSQNAARGQKTWYFTASVIFQIVALDTALFSPCQQVFHFAVTCIRA